MCAPPTRAHARNVRLFADRVAVCGVPTPAAELATVAMHAKGDTGWRRPVRLFLADEGRRRVVIEGASPAAAALQRVLAAPPRRRACCLRAGARAGRGPRAVVFRR